MHQKWPLPARSFIAPKDPVQLQSCDDEPPCELPSWCSPPESDATLEVWRVPSAPDAAPEPILLGLRPWVHFGRRQQCKIHRQPDVELHTRTASRKQALLLRNFHGQVFLLDMGSSHGTFLGRQKLQAKMPKEWKPGVVVFFADANTETFELRPRQFGHPFSGSVPGLPYAKPMVATGPTGIAGIASMVVGGNFAGARRMMGIQLGEEIAVKPKLAKVESEIGGEDEEQNDTTNEGNTEPSKAEKLYPGDWQVPADGLSKIGWKPESHQVEDSDKGHQVEEGTVSTKQVSTIEPAAVSTPVGKSSVETGSLADRLQQIMSKYFGPDVISTLRSKGPRYPCPDRPDWQLNLWSGRSRPYDPAQPAIVVIKAAVRLSVGLTRQVSLEWLSANLPTESQLLVRFTDAPLELAEPADAGRWQLDLPLMVSGNTGIVSLSSCQALPQKLFVRLCSCHSSRAADILPGGVFGSTLRPLDIEGDEWILSVVQNETQVDGDFCDTEVVDLEMGSISGTESMESVASSVSHVSTELGSETEKQRNGTSAAVPPGASFHILKEDKDQDLQVGKETNRKRQVENPSPVKGNDTTKANLGRPKTKRSRVSSPKSPSSASTSKLARMKAGVIAKRLSRNVRKEGD